MAACTHRVTTPNTNATPNTGGAFSPAVGDLLVAIMAVSGTTDAGPTMAASVTPPTSWALVLTVLQATSANRLYFFVADQLVTATTSRTLTGDTPGDAGTGTIIAVYSVSGMTLTGAAAVRQTAKEDDQASGGLPIPTFGAAVLTTNPTIGAVMNNSNPATMTPPTNWTEPATADAGYATPNTGLASCFRDSGFTGTTVTWGGTSGSAFGSGVIELDASGAAAGQPTIRRWGGVPFMGGKRGFNGSSGGGAWGRTGAGIWVPRKAA